MRPIGEFQIIQSFLRMNKGLGIKDFITQVSQNNNQIQLEEIQEDKDTNGYFPFLNLLCSLSQTSIQTTQYENLINEPEKSYHTPQPSKLKRVRSTPISQKSKEKNLIHSQTENLSPLLPLSLKKRKTLILDLDETLIHSSIQKVENYAFTVDIKIGDKIQTVYVLKRPGVDEFLIECGKYFEVVIFTASLRNYADTVINVLDKEKVVEQRLFREHCTLLYGNYVKDLARLGRELNQVIIIDNSPTSYSKHPKNAIPISSWFDDSSDRVLFDLKNHLERLSKVENVYEILKEFKFVK